VTSSSQRVQVFILAGGLGTRLRTVSGECAKPLVELGGRPFLLWQLQWLRDHGYDDIVLCIGHRANDFVSLLGDGSRYGVRLRYSRESMPLGTGGALRLAAPLLETDVLIVQNGDTYCPIDLSAAVAAHRRLAGLMTMVVTEVADVSRFGSVDFDDIGSVRGFREKTSGTGKGYINAGTYIMNKECLSLIPPNRPYSLEKGLFPELCGSRLVAHPVAVDFLDIGTPESFMEAQTFFGAKVAPQC
jgi:mannose-1-phosphate guanylyltransferase